MRIVVATVSLVLGAVMLTPAATAVPAVAQVAPSASAAPSAEPSATVAPSSSVAPSGSPLPDAVVELSFGPETETARDWAIEVTGGSPSVDFVTVEEVVGGRFHRRRRWAVRHGRHDRDAPLGPGVGPRCLLRIPQRGGTRITPQARSARPPGRPGPHLRMPLRDPDGRRQGRAPCHLGDRTNTGLGHRGHRRDRECQRRHRA